MPRVVHFEMGADKPGRAVRFYRKVFGWKIVKWAGPVDYWLCTTGPDEQGGINGALMPRLDKSFATVNFVDVPALDGFLAKVVAAGGKTVGEKETIPGVGTFIYCQDTEGNTFGMMQSEMPPK